MRVYKAFALLCLLPSVAAIGQHNTIGKHRVIARSAPTHAFTFRQNWSCSGASTITCTNASGFVSGDVLIAMAPITATIASPSVGTGTLFPSGTYSGYGQAQAMIVTGIPSGTTSFTFAGDTGSVSFTAVEVSGVNTSSPVAASAGFAGNYSAPAGTGSVTVTGSGAWEICGMISNDSTAAVYTVGTGYSSLITTSYGAMSAGLMECSNSVQSAGTYNPAITATQYEFTYGTVAFALN